MNEKTIMLPKASVLSAGRRLGIAPNRLGALLKLPDSGESTQAGTETETSWKGALSLVLAPKNLSLITLLFPDDSLLWTAELTNGESTALMGDDGETLRIRMMSPIDIVRTFARHFSPVSKAVTRMQGQCSLQSFLVLMALSDLQRGNHCLQLLSHAVGAPTITAETLQNEWEEAVAHCDLRWLLPYMRELLGYGQTLDIPAALAELNSIGLINIENGSILPTEKGEPILNMLRNRAMVCGIESLYYHEGVLQSQKTILLLSGTSVCRIELGESAILETIDEAELMKTLEVLFAPGEEAGPTTQKVIDTSVETKDNVVQVENPSWRCACGQQNTGRFCTACGMPGEDGEGQTTAAFCIQCGAPLLPEARFCTRCGAPH